ncbi:MAG: bifunctional riboflavin kinase/FAD synthetase [Ruminococcus sp.]|nr:bifunctional riboflavin kinase/FAD synthetase [Ruminococcus sp.]
MIDITENKCVCLHKTAVALGLFDGVHKGHQAVIQQAVNKKNNEIKSAVFSFKTDTITSKGHDGRLEMLLTDKAKQQHFENLGVDYLYSPDFSHFKDMTDEDFVKRVLKDNLNACVAVCGEDFRFGKNAMGNAKRLVQLGEKYEFEVCVVNQLVMNGGAISSTKIRRLINEGNISQANEMLGYKYGYTLPVEHGYERGRTWNFPTINQMIPEGLVLPRFGVYCSIVYVGDELYKGVTNIGVKPTVKVNTAPLAETFIINYDGDLYGREIKIELCEFVRPEKYFDSFDSLKAEIGRNIEFTKQYFKNNKIENI